MQIRKSASLFFCLIFYSVFPSFGESDSADHTMPLYLYSPAVYSSIRSNVYGYEKQKDSDYEKRLYGGLDLEFAFLPYVSIVTSPEVMKSERTDREVMRRWERRNIGLKFFTNDRYNNGKLSFGATFRIFGTVNSDPLLGETKDFYLFRFDAALVKKFSKLEVGGVFQFQTETNDEFQEKGHEQFRRHWLGGIYAGWNFYRGFRLLAETDYREPYNKKIDVNVRYWNFYPGMSWRKGRHLTGFAILVPVREDGFADRGGKITYAYFFN